MAVAGSTLASSWDYYVSSKGIKFPEVSKQVVQQKGADTPERKL